MKGRENTRVVVTREDGSGFFSPFPIWDSHVGKLYHIAKRELVIGDDNGILIPSDLMQEICEDYGVPREDGNGYGIAVQSRRFSKEYNKTHEFDVGGVVIKPNEAMKPFLATGENGSFIPNSLTRKPDKLLHMRDDSEGYALEFVEEE